MSETQPSLVVLAGPNGAGKSTTAPYILRETLGIVEFVNADDIARGLSGFRPENSAIAAGRLMLSRLKELAAKRVDFAFETTLASKTFAPWIGGLIAKGYAFHLDFLWLPSPEAAIQRVRDRVRHGGHDVPEPTIRRRYFAGLSNFFRLYRPLTTTWVLVDNSDQVPRLIARGQGADTTEIIDSASWTKILETCTDA